MNPNAQAINITATSELLLFSPRIAYEQFTPSNQWTVNPPTSHFKNTEKASSAKSQIHLQ